ncbi:hypothetical protein F4556_007579 [Kitasatospora gansuensis]|uniref:Uncharacterized protein n=1 Tax=Kitasatospora gansuensis TaxID=258050 RepID=A0A7W7SK33_9ACTN|nr:DUF6188 family protein [Kitasatospora gansuensis]MBB4951925.1 hypothetical protein [Kitasatospora gansuensis]
MYLKVEGRTLTRVCFDYALTLLVDPDTRIRLQANVELKDADGTSAAFQPGDTDVPADSLVRLLHKDISKAWSSDGGVLTIQFACGATLTATPDPNYEAWEILAEDGFRVICMPGGKLAIWDPK